MKDELTVFFTASYRGKDTYQSDYDLIRQTVEEFKVHLISPEAGNYKAVLTTAEIQKLKDPLFIHYEAIRRGIHLADAVIIEVSHEDFQLGHEATLTVYEKKPLLCLSSHEDFSQKIKHPFFYGAKYTKTTIKPIIQDFLVRVRELSLAKRFNLFLYPQQLEYLEKAAKKEGVNMSEYMRQLINKDKLTKH